MNQSPRTKRMVLGSLTMPCPYRAGQGGSGQRTCARAGGVGSSLFSVCSIGNLIRLCQAKPRLRLRLLKRGFMSKAADEVIRIYRENFELAGDLIERYAGPDGKLDESGMKPIESTAQTEPPDKERLSWCLAHDDFQFRRGHTSFRHFYSMEVKGELRLIGDFSKEDSSKASGKGRRNGQLAMIEAALED